MKNIKVLITGGAGFIGSHIAEEWINKGAKVIVLDNLKTGKVENLSHLKNIDFVQGDVCDESLVNKIVQDVDYIHHLAAMVSVPESIEKPKNCVEVNVNGLLNILEAAKNSNVKKIVFSSSSAIYGDNPNLPHVESFLPNPKSPYGITKLDGEYYLNMYAEIFGLKSVSLRYFNVFGERQNPFSQYAAVIPIFISKAIQEKDLLIFGDGEQTRDFIYVKDVVAANLLAALDETQIGVFNIASSRSTSVNSLAEKIISEIGSNSKIVHLEERAGEIKHSFADVSKAEEQLKFKAMFSLEEGITKTINYFKQL